MRTSRKQSARPSVQAARRSCTYPKVPLRESRKWWPGRSIVEVSAPRSRMKCRTNWPHRSLRWQMRGETKWAGMLKQWAEWHPNLSWLVDGECRVNKLLSWSVHFPSGGRSHWPGDLVTLALVTCDLRLVLQQTLSLVLVEPVAVEQMDGEWTGKRVRVVTRA